MPTYTADNAQCHVYTFKEGVLSAMAHDLKIRVDRWSMDVSEDLSRISASFEPTSLNVECVMKDGVESPGTLSGLYKGQIEKNIQKDVLKTKKFREVSFASSSVSAAGDGFEVEGTLKLCGKSGRVAARVAREGDRLVAEIPIHQPDFGIKPYSAMLGTLKIKPGIRVKISVPAP